MSINTRLNKLEAITIDKKRIIQIWLEDGETEAEAIKKWEIANNTKVKPNEQVIIIMFTGDNNEN